MKHIKISNVLFFIGTVLFTIAVVTLILGLILIDPNMAVDRTLDWVGNVWTAIFLGGGIMVILGTSIKISEK